MGASYLNSKTEGAYWNAFLVGKSFLVCFGLNHIQFGWVEGVGIGTATRRIEFLPPAGMHEQHPHPFVFRPPFIYGHVTIVGWVSLEL